MGFMYSGGGERTAIYESLLLKEKGYDVTCFAPATRFDVCYPDLLRKIDVKTFLPRVRMPLPLRDFLSMAASSALPLSFAHKFLDFDCIICHGQPAIWIGYSVSRLASKKYLCYLHQPARFLYPRLIDLEVGWKTKRDFALLNGFVNLGRPLVSAFDHVSVTASECVLVNSRWIERWVKEIYGVKPKLCPPGVDVHRFMPVAKKSSVRVGDRIVNRPFILSTNRHFPQKGMDYLIMMMPTILAEVDTTLVITGDFTSYTSTLVRLASSLKVRDKIVFTNRIDEEELVNLYQNADVYAYTSPCEDFGLGPIEAMACGTPPVVWDYAGPSENVKNGLNGFKAKPYDLHDFSSKVILLLKDATLNREMGLEGVKFANENYSWERHIRSLQELLTSLAF